MHNLHTESVHLMENFHFSQLDPILCDLTVNYYFIRVAIKYKKNHLSIV